jgi:hypothetical protein
MNAFRVQSQSYFTIGSLPPYRSSWRQAPWGSWPVIFFNWTLAVIVLCNILSEEKICLQFTIAADPRQRSHFQVRVPRKSWPHFTIWDPRLPQAGGPGPRIYIPQEQGGLVIHRSTGFPFRRLLRLAGSRWRYSTPPLYEIECVLIWMAAFIVSRILGSVCWMFVYMYLSLFQGIQLHGNVFCTEVIPRNGLHVTLYLYQCCRKRKYFKC